MKCPRCSEELDDTDELYTHIHVCEECGIIITDMKFKINTGKGNNDD